MSAENQGGAGRREVAYRLFAAEFDDADFEYSEDDDERSPNYVITPTGARVNRLFVAGVLTEIEPVNEDMLRARIVDPTGAFVVYAGQYQPDAQTFLERADPPQFVAVTGKARTFEPEDGDVIYTSIRPETINEVDAETRDRWTVQAARHTLDRIATFADALDREERGDDLADALVSEGVDAGLAEGVTLAIDHYGTTTGYLNALRETAIQAAEIVADEREEVDPLELAPDEGGEAEIDVESGIGAPTAGATAERGSATADSGDATGADAGTETTATGSTAGTASADEAEPKTSPVTEEAERPASDAAETTAGANDESSLESASESTASAAESEGDDLGDFSSYGESDESSGDREEAETPAGTDEMYEFDEEERQEIEEEYGTEFSTGTEVEDAGEADIEAAERPEEESAGTESSGGAPEGATGAGTTGETDSDPTGATETEDAEGSDEEAAHETAETAPEDVDLEDAVIEAMEELDEGDGADRDELVETVTAEYGVDADEVGDTIQDALMSGKCYEPGEDRLKAI